MTMKMEFLTTKMRFWRVLQWLHIPVPERTRQWIKLAHEETTSLNGLVWETDRCKDGYPPHDKEVAKRFNKWSQRPRVMIVQSDDITQRIVIAKESNDTHTTQA